ncbi:inactive tyrosine-protein kinase PEAK1 [Gouania willdenowi]|uniref:inactive tyrosine-protein kinase PEAK1 n=1 Tax=Gouania willdenowi TaxID=441366 RepID=UPI00105658E6|nr:inactive tyrosine-protein kinase PEAK1-like [Gouania willdenowi]
MASNKPPALPVKQHRHSSVDSDDRVFSPVAVQHQNYSYVDVFSEPVDCHAAQCPLHQPCDPSPHHSRFFSDGAPPPVPKKRLARTLSRPATDVSMLSSVSPPQQTQLHHFEDTHDDGSPFPSPSISQLTFDSTDEHLSSILNSFVDQEVVSNALQHSQLLFIRRMTEKVHAGILLQSDTSLCQPEDFLLCEDSRAKTIGNQIYYTVLNPKFPGREFGLKVHKHTDDSFSAHPKLQPSHVNVQDVIAYFTPSCLLKYDTNTNRSPACSPSMSTCSTTQPSDGGSPLTVQHLLQKGHSVSIERDLAHATLRDFVEERHSLHGADRLRYERQVCVVLLQVLMGAQRLYSSGSAAQLRPQEVLLLWTYRGREAEEAFNRIHLHKSWGLQGCPRVVLVLQSALVSGQKALATIKCEIEALIQFCLQPQENSEVVDSPFQFYKKGLLHLSSLLLNESGPKMADMVTMVQVLLWGPHTPAFSQTHSTCAAAHHWLTEKRALLVMMLAERGLLQDQGGSPLDWEDCLYLQYLSSADSETVVNVSSQLQHVLNTE